MLDQTIYKDRETSLFFVLPVFPHFNYLVCLKDFHFAYCVILEPIIGSKALERPKKHIIVVEIKRRLFGCPGDRLEHLLHRFKCFFRGHVPSIHFLLLHFARNQFLHLSFGKLIDFPLFGLLFWIRLKGSLFGRGCSWGCSFFENSFQRLRLNPLWSWIMKFGFRWFVWSSSSIRATDFEVARPLHFSVLVITFFVWIGLVFGRFTVVTQLVYAFLFFCRSICY